MATFRGRPTDGGGEPGAVGCWGACWYGGCWGGCWPGVTAEPEVVEAVARSLGQSTPEELGKMFTALAESVAKQPRR